MTRRFLVLAAILGLTGPAAGETAATVTAQAWNDMLKAHAGQPLILHFWGMTCGPCQLEMPEWGKLAAERPGLPLVLVEDDPMPMPAAHVADHLGKAGLAGVANWVLAPGDERIRVRIDSAWAGELPYTLLVGRDGKTERIAGAADMRLVRQWLDRETTH